MLTIVKYVFYMGSVCFIHSFEFVAKSNLKAVNISLIKPL